VAVHEGTSSLADKTAEEATKKMNEAYLDADFLQFGREIGKKEKRPLQLKEKH
jgi:hypothetical protein